MSFNFLNLVFYHLSILNKYLQKCLENIINKSINYSYN